MSLRLHMWSFIYSYVRKPESRARFSGSQTVYKWHISASKLRVHPELVALAQYLCVHPGMCNAARRLDQDCEQPHMCLRLCVSGNPHGC
jgi:hypothetical protein